MKKSGLAVIVALLSYTIVDIMIWQRIFETHALSKFAYLYHPGWYVMLGGELILGALLLLPNWRAALFYVSTLTLLALCGVEDVLYYWLDRRPIPDYLPWLERNFLIFLKPVTANHLLISASVWVGLCAVAFVFWCRREGESQKAHQPRPMLPGPVTIDIHPTSTTQIPVMVENLEQEL